MLAIVLSRRDFREYDQIISVYTKENGKREALARGIKKITSKNAALLLPFFLLEVEIVPGKEIDHLTYVQPSRVFTKIIPSLEKIMIEEYILKLADEFILPQEKDESIFNLLVSFLDFVNSVEKIATLNLATGFIFKLWQCLGFGAQNEKFSGWLKSDWQTINNFKVAKEDQAEAYEFAREHAQFHSGRQLPIFAGHYMFAENFGYGRPPSID